MDAAPKALSLDLDDTLWPIWPAIERAEAALAEFLAERCPNTARKYPVPEMRALRERIAAEYPEHAHDFTRQRRLSLAHAMRSAGDDEVHVEDAFNAFYAARNRVEFFPDAAARARAPSRALADRRAHQRQRRPRRDRIAHQFAVSITAARSRTRQARTRRSSTPPAASCAVQPREVLHVGDDPWLDVVGAAGVGMRTCWINRRGEDWPSDLAPPDLEFTTLSALADWPDARHPHTENAMSLPALFRRRECRARRHSRARARPRRLPGLARGADGGDAGLARRQRLHARRRQLRAAARRRRQAALRGGRGRRRRRSARALAPAAAAAAGRLRARPASPVRIDPAQALLGWGLGAYRFDKYVAPTRSPARLVLDGDSSATAATSRCCARRRWCATWSTRRPSTWARPICRRWPRAWPQPTAGARSVVGEELLAQNFPTIHAVGRAAGAGREPRLIELEWGDDAHPHVVVCGKGVCFDTGGLDLKTHDGMRHMKKDMGGAAHALALGQLVMALGLPVRLTVLVSAVENAIAGNAFRPGEVIVTRQGLSVEVDNTDAEGRLVLCDALTYGGEKKPALLLDFATLTGAARIALGPDLRCSSATTTASPRTTWPPASAATTASGACRCGAPTFAHLKSPIADLSTAGPRAWAARSSPRSTSSASCPKASPGRTSTSNAWNDNDRPGKPFGGEAQGLRAAFEFLRRDTSSSGSSEPRRRDSYFQQVARPGYPTSWRRTWPTRSR
jgi:leucyl aminopeptidase